MRNHVSNQKGEGEARAEAQPPALQELIEQLEKQQKDLLKGLISQLTQPPALQDLMAELERLISLQVPFYVASPYDALWELTAELEELRDLLKETNRELRGIRRLCRAALRRLKSSRRAR